MRNDRSSSRRTRNRTSKKIKKAREKNKEIVKVVEKIKKVGVKALRGEELEIKGELMLKEQKVYC